MGHPASMSKHVHNLRRDPAGGRILKSMNKHLNPRTDPIHAAIPRHYRIGAPDPDGEENAHLKIGNGEIPSAPVNYIPAALKVLGPPEAEKFERFPNLNNVVVDPPANIFHQKGLGLETWHFQAADDDQFIRLIVNAPNTDLPTDLNYKVFFYNACYSGRDYIESFAQGDFIFTSDYCWVYLATKEFVKGVVEGKSATQIVPLLNRPQVHGGEEEETIYELKEF